MPRLDANISLLFNEWSFPERITRAAEAGFGGVECQFPYDWAPSELAQRLRDTGLEWVMFNLPAGDWSRGERGIACLPGRQPEFRRGLETALDYAAALDCHQLNCLAGLAPSDTEPARLWDQLLDNLNWAAERLAREGMTLLIEAINTRVDMPGFLVDHSAQVLELIAILDRPNVLLQYDIYHMQVMEGDILRTLESSLDRVGHIQFADNPGRHEPGTGELDMNAIFRCLDRWGYDRWVGAEYHPAGTTLEGLAALSEWL